MNAYGELANEIFGDDSDDYNTVLVNELALGAILITAAQIAADSEFTTRSQVIDAIGLLTGLFNDSVNYLDGKQKNFDGFDIDNQYFSNSQSYTDILLLNRV